MYRKVLSKSDVFALGPATAAWAATVFTLRQRQVRSEWVGLIWAMMRGLRRARAVLDSVDLPKCDGLRRRRLQIVDQVGDFLGPVVCFSS